MSTESNKTIFKSHGRYHGNSKHIQVGNSGDPNGSKFSSNGRYEDNAAHIQLDSSSKVDIKNSYKVSTSQKPKKRIQKKRRAGLSSLSNLTIEECDNCNISSLELRISTNSPKITLHNIRCQKITKLESLDGMLTSAQMEYDHDDQRIELSYQCPLGLDSILLKCNGILLTPSIFNKNQYEWEDFKKVISNFMSEQVSEAMDVDNSDQTNVVELQLKLGTDRYLKISNVDPKIIKEGPSEVSLEYCYMDVNFKIVNKRPDNFRSEKFGLFHGQNAQIDPILFIEDNYSFEDFAKIVREGTRYPPLAEEEVKKGIACQKCHKSIPSANTPNHLNFCNDCRPQDWAPPKKVICWRQIVVPN